MASSEKNQPAPLRGPIRELIVALRLDDQSGRPLAPATADIGLLRAHLERVLVDTVLRQQHTELLKDLYRGPFRAPCPRRDLPEGARPEPPAETVFRHHRLLPEPLALAIGRHGLDALPSDELARLALNPYALWDLADLIEETLPDYWLDRMEDRGGELMRELGITLQDILPPDPPLR
jgi:hypothetical protein